MSDTLYIQLEQNVTVNHPHIYLQDIARLSCSNSKILNRLRVLPIKTFDEKKSTSIIMSISELITLIHTKEPDISISSTGESNFVIIYEKQTFQNPIIKWLKVVFVCFAVFFGSAFSIMTFNNDVDTRKLFSQIHLQITGTPSSGFTLLEISYSIGIGIGILFFFNHFNRKKQINEPSPMKVQMNTYEEDVNKTRISNKN